MRISRENPEIGEEIAECVRELTSWETQYRSNLAKSSNDRVVLLKGECEVISGMAKRADKLLGNLNFKSVNRHILSLAMIGNSEKPIVIDAIHSVLEVRDSIISELEGIKFIRATEDMVEYLNKRAPFGDAVNLAFSHCIEDADEAHKCFAFARYTASMFHLGRAMEIAVKLTAKKMRVKAHRDEWQAYLTAMQEHINKMPFKTPKDKAKRAVWSYHLSELSGQIRAAPK